MCQEMQANIKIKELVFKTLLFEILKDGQVDASERQSLQNCAEVLNISRDRLVELKNEVVRSLPTEKSQEAANFSQLFSRVRESLLDSYPAEATDNYLEQLAKSMGKHEDFMDSLSMGF